MIDINYQKRKNAELFKSMENPNILNLSNTQNYIPIYTRLFSLNETNYNNINLNNNSYIYDIHNKEERNRQLFNSVIKSISKNNKTEIKPVFFKLAPLLDPFKYLSGKYIKDNNLLNLPKLSSSDVDTHTKFLDVNNSAYVDSFFLFLSSFLINTHGFIHGVDFYGSFLAIKNDFEVNIFDDIDYLLKSDFFNKNKNVLFKIDEEELCMFQTIKTKPLIIHNSIKSQLSVEPIEELFENKLNNDEIKYDDELCDIVNIDEFNEEIDTVNKNFTLKSNSSCSSRSSHTSVGEDLDEEDEDEEDSDEEDSDEEDEDEEDVDEEDDSDEEDVDDEDEIVINATIPKFPVQVICMEYCEDTFDNLIMDDQLTNDEWYSILMQIIMILLTYQKAFAFTHNDLHTNNVMYVQTNQKYIYYKYKNKMYRVPTYGKIIKIIDFGRSIYKFNGKVFCSDSYKAGGDAESQYNIEPYFNDKKPRLEPNFSFDLCRLACAIFDFIVDNEDDPNNKNKIKDPIQRLINEWCLDDKGLHMLYKTNGQERYPEFKLYKMIARCVHNHTPEAQLQRPEFKQFEFKGKIKNTNNLINIDNIPSFI